MRLTMTTGAEAGRYSIQAVATSLRVLDELAHHPWQTAKECAESIGITHTQAFRILATLEESGYVQRNAFKKYAVGYKGFVLGKSAEQEVSLIRQAAPVMDELTKRTSENVHIVRRDGLERIVVDVRESRHRIRLVSPIGNRHPLYIGGTGLVILAHSPKEVIDAVLAQPLQRFSQYTTVDPEIIRQVLPKIRSDGYHIAIQDFDDDAFSVAGPIWNADGTVDSSLCITGPVMRLDVQKQREYTALVLEACKLVSAGLGHC